MATKLQQYKNSNNTLASISKLTMQIAETHTIYTYFIKLIIRNIRVKTNQTNYDISNIKTKKQITN